MERDMERDKERNNEGTRDWTREGEREGTSEWGKERDREGQGKAKGQAKGRGKGQGRDKGKDKRTREGKNGGPLVLLYCKYDTKCHNTNFMSYFYPVAKILISNTSSNQTQILYKPLLNEQHVAEIKDRTHSHLVHGP